MKGKGKRSEMRPTKISFPSVSKSNPQIIPSHLQASSPHSPEQPSGFAGLTGTAKIHKVTPKSRKKATGTGISHRQPALQEPRGFTGRGKAGGKHQISASLDEKWIKWARTSKPAVYHPLSPTAQVNRLKTLNPHRNKDSQAGWKVP